MFVFYACFFRNVCPTSISWIRRARCREADGPGARQQEVAMIDEHGVCGQREYMDNGKENFNTARRQNFGQGCRLASSN